MGTKKPPKVSKSDRIAPIDGALRKRTKAELTAMLLAIAKEHPAVARGLEERLNIMKPVKRLVADVSTAIDRATDFDERLMNHNFNVDWQAYAEVQKGLAQLVERGQLADAKSLALKLMKDGSRQVECSDEGLMTDDICECLRPVIRAVKAAGGDAAERWAKDMKSADRGGFICGKELAQMLGST